MKQLALAVAFLGLAFRGSAGEGSAAYAFSLNVHKAIGDYRSNRKAAVAEALSYLSSAPRDGLKGSTHSEETYYRRFYVRFLARNGESEALSTLVGGPHVTGVSPEIVNVAMMFAATGKSNQAEFAKLAVRHLAGSNVKLPNGHILPPPKNETRPEVKEEILYYLLQSDLDLAKVHSSLRPSPASSYSLAYELMKRVRACNNSQERIALMGNHCLVKPPTDHADVARWSKDVDQRRLALLLILDRMGTLAEVEALWKQYGIPAKGRSKTAMTKTAYINALSLFPSDESHKALAKLDAMPDNGVNTSIALSVALKLASQRVKFRVDYEDIMQLVHATSHRQRTIQHKKTLDSLEKQRLQSPSVRATAFIDKADLARASLEKEISRARRKAKKDIPLTPEQIEKFRDIADLYQKAILLCPKKEESARAFLRLAGLHCFQREYDVTRQILEKALAEHKGTAQERSICFHLGLHYRQIAKDPDEASHWFTRAQDLTPKEQAGGDQDVMGKAISQQMTKPPPPPDTDRRRGQPTPNKRQKHILPRTETSKPSAHPATLRNATKEPAPPSAATEAADHKQPRWALIAVAIALLAATGLVLIVYGFRSKTS